MDSINILYDIQRPELTYLVREGIAQLSKMTDTQINIEICVPFHPDEELLDKLKRNPNYNLVILHVGTQQDGASRQSQKCRRLTDAPLIAESAMYPQGRDELLKDFDDYIGPLVNPDNLENILRKYGVVFREI